MANINNNSINFSFSQPPSHRPPPPKTPAPKLSGQQTQDQVRAMAWQTLQELSKQYINPQQNCFKNGKDKEIYPQLVTNSSGEILGLTTTSKKEWGADISKVEEYVRGILDKKGSGFNDYLLNQLQIFKDLRAEAVKKAEADANAIPNKLKDLKLNRKEGKSETIKTIDGRSCKRTTFITKTKDKNRIVRLYEDSEGPIALVYPSSKGTNCNNNGRVKNMYGKRIVCRDMAAYQIRHRNDDKLKWREILNNPKQMEKQKELNEIGFSTIEFIQQPNKIYMCSPFNIGDALYEMVVNNENPTPPAALFSSYNHVMAINIEKRQKGGVLLKFYDPNQSDDILRILVPSVDQLKKLTTDFLLNEKQFTEYFPKNTIENIIKHTEKNASQQEVNNGNAIFEYFKKKFSKEKPTHELCASLKVYDDPIKPIGNWQDTKVELLIPKNIANDPELNQRWLTETLRMGILDNQSNVGILDMILNSKELTKDEKFLCMKASTSESPVPVITWALSFGNTETIKVYMKAVLSYPDFSDKEKYELLGGFENGYSCLFRGFISDDNTLTKITEAVMCYVKAVVADPNLPLHYKVKLLRAEFDSVGFGLDNCKNHQLSYDFTKFIKNCNLDNEAKNKILLMH